MKERIKELLGQAGFDVKRLLEPYPGGFPREDFLALESFAELIVRECINTLEFHGFDDAVPYIKWMATNKLGVEE